MSGRFFTADEWRNELAGQADAERKLGLIERFVSAFGDKKIGLFSAPGRTEIGGNHTDHENGRVLAAAVNLDTLAAVAPNGDNVIRLNSDGYRPCTVGLGNLVPQPREVNTTSALIRGVAAAFVDSGTDIGGFDMVMTSNVLPGSGLSSSAAVEVLLGVVMNVLFNGGKASPVEIAQIGQYAENVYFGKPSGLMDQTASSVGGLVTIDFADTENPIVKPVKFDFSKTGYHLCILDSGANHANLTGEYAAIVEELRAVCAVFGKTVLREVSEEDFWARLPEVREKAGDRAALRAMHIYADNKRVSEQVAALERGDFPAFLALVRESGRSSWLMLQNVTPKGATKHQELALTIALGEKLLGKRGACRVHGGGFAGTAQAFVPDDLLDEFVKKTEAVLGEGHCHVLSIRQAGGIQL